MVTNKQTNKQPADPSASLLLTIEKAVFCNDDYYNHITTILQPYDCNDYHPSVVLAQSGGDHRCDAGGGPE